VREVESTRLDTGKPEKYTRPRWPSSSVGRTGFDGLRQFTAPAQVVAWRSGDHNAAASMDGGVRADGFNC
jgi:hypothetical protein